jgi:alpha-mannosidase
MGPFVFILMKGGSLAEAAVVRAAYNFNNPMRIGHVATSSAAMKIGEYMETIQFSGSPNVILDTVKRGEDDDDVTSTPIKKRDSRNVILRIYEAYGGKGTAKILTYAPEFGGLLIVDIFLFQRLFGQIFLRMMERRLMCLFLK